MIQASVHNQYSELVYFGSFALVVLPKILLPNYLGQRVINSSEKLITSIYETSWYEQKPLYAKYVSVMMSNCQDTIAFNVEGYFDLDLENFKKIMNAAYSFYAVLSHFK
jgi:ABC-type uncharacterized transport system fused permease/ATPase subunit